MIQRMTLRRFKAFDKFALKFGEKAMLVGPNSAGKSTLIAALRTGAAMLRHARARKPTRNERHHTGWFASYDLDAARFDLEAENLRHEFHDDVETKIEIGFAGGALLTAVWPRATDDEDDPPPNPFFYLTTKTRQKDRVQPRGPADVRRNFPTLGIVPPLRPLELHERLLETDYVKGNLVGRLTSSHFRNQLRLLHDNELEDSWDDFETFASEWLPEISFTPPELRYADRVELDLFYAEGRTPKEIAWAGDGYQVFLQLLLHIFRNRNSETIILDEPDLYLHADLQRRLLQVVDSIAPQVIMATHSSELLVETPSEAVVWIDKSRERGLTSPDPTRLNELSQQIGTRFNLRLAKALRSKVIVFVEGQDMRLIHNVAATLGLRRLATEQDVAVIPIEGFSNWRRLEGFGWLVDHLLQRSVEGFIILDRDYHSDHGLEDARRQLGDSGLHCHIWQRKELESYFLSVPALARVSRAEPDWIREELFRAAESMKNYLLSRLQALRVEERPNKATNPAEELEHAADDLDQIWNQGEERLFRASAKDLFSSLNFALQQEEKKTVSARKLSKEIRSAEVPLEMVEILRTIEVAAS